VLNDDLVVDAQLANTDEHVTVILALALETPGR
jgi:hypothetical protein